MKTTTEENATVTTKEPVTVGGWYEHTDGTVGEYRWVNGFCKLVYTARSWGHVAEIKWVEE